MHSSSRRTLLRHSSASYSFTLKAMKETTFQHPFESAYLNLFHRQANVRCLLWWLQELNASQVDHYTWF